MNIYKKDHMRLLISYFTFLSCDLVSWKVSISYVSLIISFLLLCYLFRRTRLSFSRRVLGYL
jgi:uncharacterized membrane protein